MINKDEYYMENSPDQKTKNRIWKNIEKNIKPERRSLFDFRLFPGFYYGMAASVILFFTCYGIYSFGKSVLYEMKPEELKLNTAYTTAIREFEKVVPAAVSAGNYYQKDLLGSKMEQLNQIESAILELKRETYNNDLTPLKQLHLRQLYVTKLKILLEIIEQGEVTL